MNAFVAVFVALLSILSKLTLRGMISLERIPAP